MREGVLRWLNQRWNGEWSQRHMLALALLIIGVTSGIYGLFLAVPYDPQLNIRLAIFLGICALLLCLPNTHHVVAHLLIGACGLTVFLISTQTGGMNSLAMIWLAAVPMLPLFLTGMRGTVSWLVVTVLSMVLMHVMTSGEWVLSSNAHVLMAIPWGYFTVTILTLLIMTGVILYDQLHRKQMRRLAQSNEALAQTHAALVSMQNLREEFVASVGHELRTPMNAILGFNNVLRDRVGPDPMVTATVDHIHDATHQLLDLVNDILDFSQLQAAKMQVYPVPCDVVQALKKTCADWQEKARIKGIDFSLQVSRDIPECLLLDVEKFSKVAHKLLDNALKFTSSGSVQVSLSPAGNLFKLEVEDTGQGISPAVQRQIFRRFERADMETNRKYGGAGLGLAICEGLLELMGGRIDCRSQEGQGTTFCVLLPLVELPPQAKPEPSPHDTARLNVGDECRVLLVDDNKINLLVAKAQLNRLWPDMRIVCCQSAGMAWDVLKNSRFDLALLDVMMPDVDGLELTRRLRGHPDPAVATMPILAFTANVGSDEHMRCLRAGVNDVLTKPMDEKRMREVIARVLWSAQRESAHVH